MQINKWLNKYKVARKTFDLVFNTYLHIHLLINTKLRQDNESQGLFGGGGIKM